MGNIILYPKIEMFQAIRGAINTARENKDNITALHSLAWLRQFAKKAALRGRKEIPMLREENMRRESLQYLKMNAKDPNSCSLVAIVSLLEAQQLVCNVCPFRIAPLTS